MKKKIYYGVAGINGYGVYDDHDSVLISKPFITSFTMKGFHDFDEAKVFAVDMYRYMQDELFGIYEIEELEEKNWFYRRKFIERYPGPRYDMSVVITDNNFFEKGSTGHKSKPFSVGI